MNDNECVQFLQWALPRLHMRWPGVRKVRGQVCKRIGRRMRQLHLADVAAYKTYLQEHDREWSALDALSRITISRFYRDKALFDCLARQVLPMLVQDTLARHDTKLKVWSAGCASGEEAYTISLLWRLQLQTAFPDITIAITATDAGGEMIERAQTACYSYSSIKNLPPPWRKQAFVQHGEDYCLKPEFRQPLRFIQQDIRHQIPNQRFDLVLCRNLAFTYFDTPLQCAILDRIQSVINAGGVLVIGSHEKLPSCAHRLSTWSEKLGIYIA